MRSRARLRVLMPSIVDGAIRRGGAWTVTRGILDLLRAAVDDPDIVSVVPPEPRWRRARQAACLLRAPVSGVPAKVLFARSGEFRRRLRQLVARQQFDLLLVNGSDLLWVLDEARSRIPTLAVVHNRESNLYRDQVLATAPRAPLLRRALLADGTRLDRFETERLQRVRGAIFLSTSDAATFAGRIPGLNHLVVPPLFSQTPDRVAKRGAPDTLDLGLLANFGWWPNREALTWLLRDVLPQLPGSLRVHLFGHLSTAMAKGDPRVIAHGFVDDLRDVWRSCDWMIVPTRFGSGISVKTAESLYQGMPVLSTPFGMRGLPAFDQPQIVIRDSAAEWVSFLSSPEARVLCQNRLPAEFSDHFRIATYRDAFKNLLSRVCD